MRVLTTFMACMAVLCGCTTAHRSLMTEVHGGIWSEPAVVTLTNSDTTGFYDLRIALWHDALTEGTKANIMVRTETPDSLWVEEPLVLTVADDGRSRSSGHETSCIYRRSVRLVREGDYRIILTPVSPLRGIRAVGIDLEPSAAQGR